MNYRLFLVKRTLEDIIMYPLILIGKALALLKPQDHEYELFFFFPFYHIGGAEKVHAQIACATGNVNCIIYFTRKSQNDLLRKEFEASGCIIRDISTYTDNKWLYFINIIYRGRIAQYINLQKKKPVVFNGQCNFGYKISPWVSRKITQIELIHSLNSFSFIRIPFLPFISKTIMISKRRIEDHIKLYKQLAIPQKYETAIGYISNAIKIPTADIIKPQSPLTILFVGRGTSEKRPHLFAAIAASMSNDSTKRFEMLGEMDKDLMSSYPSIHFWGNQGDEKMISSIYQRAHILVLTSETEGFPMVVIEAMAHGLAVIATPVGDIPYHISNKSGFLFSSIEDEDIIVSEARAYIEKLAENNAELEEISNYNRVYAKNHFSIENFNNAYRKLLK
jgi:glycosyltransferase involved in cell wall biosynthesis